jgi:hypothetical protein
MKLSNLKIPAVAALMLGAVTSANAAMPVPRTNFDTSMVLVACAYGWFRGPDGQCYPYGWRPGYNGGYYRRWHRPYYGYYRAPYRPYQYYPY